MAADIIMVIIISLTPNHLHCASTQPTCAGQEPILSAPNPPPVLRSVGWGWGFANDMSPLPFSDMAGKQSDTRRKEVICPFCLLAFPGSVPISDFSPWKHPGSSCSSFQTLSEFRKAAPWHLHALREQPQSGSAPFSEISGLSPSFQGLLPPVPSLCSYSPADVCGLLAVTSLCDLRVPCLPFQSPNTCLNNSLQ